MFFLLCIVCVLFSGCVSKDNKYDYTHERGYAPYKMHIEEGWEKVSADYPGFKKRFSENLPSSNFNIQVIELVKPGKDKYATLEGLSSEFIRRRTENKADIQWAKNIEIADVPAKDILDVGDLTIRKTTRGVYTETIILVIKGYAYIFTLGTFEKDYEGASKEFHKMVESFEFVIPEEHKKTHQKIVERINSGNYQ